MFTGLIEALATVTEQTALPAGGSRLRLGMRWPLVDGTARPTALGDSVAVNGCCLTVIARTDDDGSESLLFELSHETLQRTAFATLQPGARVNVERALRMGDRLGGHLVSGHVDGLGQLVEITPRGDFVDLRYSLPTALEPELVEKGSIAVDGVSLTVNAVPPGGFVVTIIPHTAEHTQLLDGGAGKAVHLESDLLAKHVRRLLQFVTPQNETATGLTVERLRRAGFA